MAPRAGRHTGELPSATSYGARVLIGRDREVAALAAKLDEAIQGRSSSLLALGDPGIGKSALAREAIRLARERDIRVLRARGVEAEVEMPFAALSELLGPVLGHREQIPAVQREALEAALALEPAVDTPDRFAVAAATLSLLAAAAEERPVLAVVDDAHWADDASVDSFLFAARRLGSEGVMMLLAARPRPDRGLAGRGMFEFRLDPLEDGDARRLVREARSEALAQDEVEQVVTAAEGNPLALLELPGDALEDPALGPPAPGARVERTFRATLAELPADTLEGLTVVAADEGAAPATVASALERLGLAPDVLAAAERVHVLEVSRGHLRFRHPLLRSVVYHGAPDDRRRQAHAALADATPRQADPVSRAWHRAAAVSGHDDDVAAELEAAAASARNRGATISAAHALTRAAELTSDATERAGRLLAAARDWSSTSRPARCAELAAEALELTDDPLLRADLERVRGEVMIRMGQFDAAHDMLTVAAEQVAPLDARRGAEAYLAASVRHRASGSYGQMRRDAERARELVKADHPDVARFADLVLAHTLVVSGEREAGDALIARHEEGLVTALARDEVTIELLTSPAHASLWAEQTARAERITRLMVGRARQRSAAGDLIFPLGIQSQLLYRGGRWRAAYAGAEEAVQLAADTDQRALLAYTSGVLAEIEASMGRADEARTTAERVLAITDPADATAIGLYARAALGLAELGRGQAAQAVEPLQWCAEASRRLGLAEPNVHRWAPNLVEALARAGRLDEAADALAGLDHAAAATGGRWARGCALRCHGLLDEAGEYGRLLGEAIEILDAAGEPFEAARARQALGERLRRDKRRRDARAPLQRALEEYERLGAADWAARARQELDATGQATGGAQAERTGDLTPHELRVALLVAEGRSNPEVAAELFVSRKTVEFHLGQIYRKLGLRSRTELARVLATELPAHPAEDALRA